MRFSTLTLLALALLAACQAAALPAQADGAEVAEAGELLGGSRALLRARVPKRKAKAKKKGKKKAKAKAKGSRATAQARWEAAALRRQQAAQAALVARGRAAINKQAAAAARAAAKQLAWAKAYEAKQLAYLKRLEKAQARKGQRGGGKRSSGNDVAAAIDPAGGSSGCRNPGPIWGCETGRGAPPGGPVQRATYHYYAPGYETSSLYCADQFNKFLPVGPRHWILQYPWVAYCGSLGPMSQDKCGKCIKITNLATNQWVKARVVDMCGFNGVDMDPLAFNAIDGNGQGVVNGAMNIKMEWC